MGEFQMIFERESDGSLAARMPRGRDGKPIEPDGVRYFSLQQAAAYAGKSEAELAEKYDAAFGFLYPEPQADGLQVRGVDERRVYAGRRDLIHAHRFPHLTDSELDVVLERAAARDLDPWVHLWAEVRYRGGRREMSLITTIAAFILIAERTGKYQGTTEAEYLDHNGVWHERAWPAHLGNPVAARAGVRRAGWAQPQYETATWDRYVQYVQTERGMEISEAWMKGGAEQLFKCAKALAFRGTFPELGGLYLREEMGQANNPPTSPAGQGDGAPPSPRPPAPMMPTRAPAPVDAGDEEAPIDNTTPDTVGDFSAALEAFGFTTEQGRKAVIHKLRQVIPFAPTSRTFFAKALYRLRQRPDLYGARIPMEAGAE